MDRTNVLIWIRALGIPVGVLKAGSNMVAISKALFLNNCKLRIEHLGSFGDVADPTVQERWHEIIWNNGFCKQITSFEYQSIYVYP